MFSLIRPVLFSLDPETSHDLVMTTLSWLSRSNALTRLIARQTGARLPSLSCHVMGLDFPNPVGLAAGLDKQGNCANVMSALGFGWVELGTVTPLPQPGNPKPRMFRLEQHHAIINRMGFNSCGLDAFLQNVSTTLPGIIKGINIGKNAITPVDQASDDYLTALEAVYCHADYVTVNISSPNTSNLRSLQQDNALDQLLSAICLKRQQLADRHGMWVPLVLKIAPDLDRNQINTIALLLRKHRIDGVAATNTTIARHSVIGHRFEYETGGLSGAPVRKQSSQVVMQLWQNLQGEIPIIGIGGVDSVESAREKFAAGADLIQIYTGFIYRGPSVIREIVEGLAEACGDNEFSSYLQSLRCLPDTTSGRADE